MVVVCLDFCWLGVVCCSVAVLQLVFVVVDDEKFAYIYISMYRYVDIKFF